MSFKVPKHVKRRTKKSKPYVNWPDELRRLLIRCLEEKERELTFEKIIKIYRTQKQITTYIKRFPKQL